ncbi:hypothetical protein KAR91_57600 [Candidatus Pacearchaeota archaeon]|nr:hypothetical protein [Candidatus Pacearchaeota archaeon]
MKTVVFCIVCIILTILVMVILGNGFSKEDEVQRIVEAGKELNPPYGAGPLVSIVWYKGSGQLPHKIFATSRDIEDIRYRLEYKGAKSTAKNETLDFAQGDRLSFVYYGNDKDKYRVKYVPFKIEDGIFYWPYGEDKKVAQILINKENWEKSFPPTDPSMNNIFDKQKEMWKKPGIADKSKMISKIEETLPERKQMNQDEIKLSDICKKAKRNILDLVGYYTSEVTLNDILLELEKNDMYENLVHSFTELPKSMIEKYGKSIKPEYISRVKHFSKKFYEEGLDRKEQVELFQIRQKINKQIIDELQRRQDDFERVLKINESNQKLVQDKKE